MLRAVAIPRCLTLGVVGVLAAVLGRVVPALAEHAAGAAPKKARKVFFADPFIHRAVLAWLGGGWQTALTTHVVEAYIGNARAAARYLQPGDRVTIHVDRLGVIENEIVP